jgi:hypothetical protein
MANGLIDFGIMRPNAAMETYQQGQQNQLAQMQMNQAQQAAQDAELERGAYKGAANLGEVSQRLMQQGLGKQALAVSAAQAKQQADQIAMHKDKLTLMKAAATRAMADPANAEAILMDYGKQTNSDVTSELEQLRKRANDPDSVRLWAASHALEADKLLPKFETRDLGGTVERQGYSPLNGKAIGPAEVRNKTATPGELLTDARATEREARLAQGPMGVGLSPEQNDALFGENGAATTGKINPNKINSRNAKLWADAFLKNPSANPVKVAQEVAASDAAVKSFLGDGKAAQKVESANTAIGHLQSLKDLYAAQQNGDTRAFNAAANAISSQFGGAPPTNLQMAVQIVGPEIAKSVIGTSGSMREREEFVSGLSGKAASPAQFAGAIDTTTGLLTTRLGEVENSYKRQTKRDDFRSTFLNPTSRAILDKASATAAPAAAPNVVVTPDGQSHTFPTPDAAAQFKKAAGIP